MGTAERTPRVIPIVNYCRGLGELAARSLPSTGLFSLPGGSAAVGTRLKNTEQIGRCEQAIAVPIPFGPGGAHGGIRFVLAGLKNRNQICRVEDTVQIGVTVASADDADDGRVVVRLVDHAVAI